MGGSVLLCFKPAASPPRHQALWQIFVGFWLLGLINNSAYVIMIAGANEIASSAVGLVYFCAIGPTILVKLTAPYWFHLVPYSVRFWVAALLMAASFCIVALSSNVTAQLVGVALVAVQGGLGEASALGLCSRHPNQLSLTAWSSGTGFAGIVGYAWVAVLHYWLQLSYTITLLIATVMPGLWLVVFHSLMALSSQQATGSSSGSTTLLHTHYREVPTSAAAEGEDNDGTEALLRPDSRFSSSTGGSSGSRTTSPEVELSSPASSAPDTSTEQHQQQQQQQQDSTIQIESQPPPQQQQQQSVPQLRTQQQQQLQRPNSSLGRRPLSRHGGQQHQQHQLHHQSVIVHVSTTATIDSSSISFSRGGESVAYHRTAAADADAEERQQSCDNHRQGSGSRHMLTHGIDPQHMTGLQRLKATCALWPYMVPLFVVYFAEYAMQAGTWSSIGFPVTSPHARQLFYMYSNWTYQAGVCISRSSGMLFQANRVVLWVMPVLQCLLLAFFSLDAVLHVWWNWGLLSLCFVAGLLGGAVYVNSFTLMSREVQPALREFSLSAACVADSVGIACADLVAILIQGCLFKLQGLTGAAYSCGDAAH